MNAKSLASLSRTSLALAVVTAICSAGAMNAGAAPYGTNPTAAVARTTILERGDAITIALPMTQLIHIEVALKMRNRDVLDAFIANNAKNQAKGLAAQIMSRDQFLANHAPTQAQAQKVVNYLTSMGYRNVVVAANRLLVSADGTAATARNAFQTTFAQVKTHDGRIAFANTGDAHVPLDLQDSVLSVVGLQTVHVPRTFARPAAQTGTLTGHNPNQFPSIYDASGIATGAGVTVGIITQGDLTQTIADLNTFTKNNSLPTVTTQTINTGGISSAAPYIDEWDLDSQDIVGMAGGQVGKIVFYDMAEWVDTGMVADFNTAVVDNQAKIINGSIQYCETYPEDDGSAAAADQIFAMADAQGQTFSIATGDYGTGICSGGTIAASWPADSPYVVAVGGTDLYTTNGGSTWADETVWDDGGGAPSTFEPKPYWQDVLVPGSKRGVPDISLDADPSSGANIVYYGALTEYGGTSLAAPLFSGMWARVLAAKGTNIGFAAPLIYELPESDFHDVTAGNNGGETAGVGYDFASGRGSIDLGIAINHLGVTVGNPPVPNFSWTTSGLIAHFTDASTDQGGTVVAHFWNFGDNSPLVTTTNPSHTYAGAGTYNVSETVEDNNGNVRFKATPVTVVPPGGSNQLIANTGFETGTSPWVFSSPNIRNNNPAEPSHGGQWDAWLGVDGNGSTDSVSQQVTIPSGKTTANLQFFLHIDTQEITQTRPFDKLNVGVYSTGGALLGTLATFSNLNAANGYQVQTYSLAPWIGQTVVLQFSATLDSSLPTDFVLDDVTLQAK